MLSFIEQSRFRNILYFFIFKIGREEKKSAHTYRNQLHKKSSEAIIIWPLSSTIFTRKFTTRAFNKSLEWALSKAIKSVTTAASFRVSGSIGYVQNLHLKQRLEIDYPKYVHKILMFSERAPASLWYKGTASISSNFNY